MRGETPVATDECARVVRSWLGNTATAKLPDTELPDPFIPRPARLGLGARHGGHDAAADLTRSEKQFQSQIRRSGTKGKTPVVAQRPAPAAESDSDEEESRTASFRCCQGNYR